MPARTRFGLGRGGLLFSLSLSLSQKRRARARAPFPPSPLQYAGRFGTARGVGGAADGHEALLRSGGLHDGRHRAAGAHGVIEDLTTHRAQVRRPARFFLNFASLPLVVTCDKNHTVSLERERDERDSPLERPARRSLARSFFSLAKGAQACQRRGARGRRAARGVLEREDAGRRAAVLALVHEVCVELPRRIWKLLELEQIHELAHAQQIVGVRPQVVVVRDELDARLQLRVRDVQLDHVLERRILARVGDEPAREADANSILKNKT